jgi:hypothetical protein
MRHRGPFQSDRPPGEGGVSSCSERPSAVGDAYLVRRHHCPGDRAGGAGERTHARRVCGLMYKPLRYPDARKLVELRIDLRDRGMDQSCVGVADARRLLVAWLHGTVDTRAVLRCLPSLRSQSAWSRGRAAAGRCSFRSAWRFHFWEKRDGGNLCVLPPPAICGGVTVVGDQVHGRCGTQIRRPVLPVADVDAGGGRNGVMHISEVARAASADSTQRRSGDSKTSRPSAAAGRDACDVLGPALSSDRSCQSAAKTCSLRAATPVLCRHAAQRPPSAACGSVFQQSMLGSVVRTTGQRLIAAAPVTAVRRSQGWNAGWIDRSDVGLA